MNENPKERHVVLCQEAECNQHTWQIVCQSYPRIWWDHHRLEKWAAKSRLRRVARQLAKYDIDNKQRYWMAIWAGYTKYEAAYIIRLIKQDCDGK